MKPKQKLHGPTLFAIVMFSMIGGYMIAIDPPKTQLASLGLWAYTFACIIFPSYHLWKENQ